MQFLQLQRIMSEKCTGRDAIRVSDVDALNDMNHAVNSKGRLDW